MTSVIQFVQYFRSDAGDLALLGCRNGWDIYLHTYAPNQIWRPHSVPTSLVIVGSNLPWRPRSIPMSLVIVGSDLDTSLRSYVTGHSGIKVGDHK